MTVTGPTDLNHPTGSVTYIVYNGLSVTITDPKGNTSTKVVNALGKLVASTDAEGNTISYTYDPVGDLWGCAPHPKTRMFGCDDFRVMVCK